jgi:hypothetical protein
MLAGAIRTRTETPGGRVSSWALRPLISQIRSEDGDYMDRTSSRRWAPRASAAASRWCSSCRSSATRRSSTTRQPGVDVLHAAGHRLAAESRGKIRRAVFPIAGVFENFLTFDKSCSSCVPLYLRRSARPHLDELLWPIFNYTSGTGARARASSRYGPTRTRAATTAGSSCGRSSTTRRTTSAVPPPQQERIWSFWPILQRESTARSSRGASCGPLYGYSYDTTRPASGPGDGPWPARCACTAPAGSAVGGGASAFWPIYSHYKGDGQEEPEPTPMAP